MHSDAFNFSSVSSRVANLGGPELLFSSKSYLLSLNPLLSHHRHLYPTLPVPTPSAPSPDSSPLYCSVLLTLAEVRLHVGIQGQTYAADRVCFSPVQPVRVVPDLVCTTAPPLQDELKVMTPRPATQVPAVSSSCLTFVAQITTSAVFTSLLSLIM